MRKSQTRIEHEDAKLSNDPLKLEYEDYLRNQRGLSERTIYHCWRFADRFRHQLLRAFGRSDMRQVQNTSSGPCMSSTSPLRSDLGLAHGDVYRFVTLSRPRIFSICIS